MEYHKIQSLFKRDPLKNNKQFLMGQYTLPEFEYLKDLPWVGTEKVDGTNIRVYKEGDRIAGRTDNAQIHGGLIEHLKSVQAKLAASDLPSSTILYGEGYGAKIQSGGQYLPESQSFVLFDVVISGNYQPRTSVLDMAIKLELPVVPLIQTQSLTDWVDSIKDGKYKESMLHPGAINEGVVLRPEVELRTRDGDRIITKLKFKDFGL